MGDLGYNSGHLLYTTNPRDAVNIRGHGQHNGGAIVNDHTSEQPQTKTCTKCGETKDVSAFSKDACAKDGLQCHCKACHAQENARWRQDHREEQAQYQAQYRQDHREEKARYDAQWRQTHPRYGAQRMAQRRLYHPQYDAQWKKDNRDKCRAAWHRHRARKLENGGTHTSADIQRQGQAQKWLCWWCGKSCEAEHHADHLVPLSRGGHNDISNIVISCPHCNLSKNNKLPEEWCDRLL